MPKRKSIVAFCFLLLISIEMKSNTMICKIPFELFGEHIFMKFNIDSSQALDFIFDTGAGATIVNSNTARRIGFQSNDATQVMGAGGLVDMKLYKPKAIYSKNIKLTVAEVIGADLWMLERGIGKKIDGIIGKDILDKYVVKINYSENTVELYSFHEFVYKGKGKKYDLSFVNGLPAIKLDILFDDEGKNLQGKFLIDTGAGMSLVFATPFSKENNIIDCFTRYYISETADITNLNSRAFNSVVPQISIDEYRLNDFPIQAMDAQHGVYAWNSIAGMLGNEVLKRFNITYNYNKSCAYFEKNVLYAELFNIDCSGLDIERDFEKDEIVIKEVIADSPANKAGLQIFDVIQQINGKSASDYGIPKIKRLLAKKGGEVELLIKRGNSTILVTLNLIRII